MSNMLKVFKQNFYSSQLSQGIRMISDYNPKFGNWKKKKKSNQTLKNKRAYLMSQVTKYYKDVESAHITVATFLLHYSERWRYYMSVKIYILFQIYCIR